MKRCVICDYTQEHGSDYANRAPDHKVHVQTDPHGDFLCDECLAEVNELEGDYALDDLDDEEV